MADPCNEHIQQAENSLKHDPDLNEDGVGERFFNTAGWLKDLPETAQQTIWAVQAVGEHPDRPIFLHQLAAQSFALWKMSKSRQGRVLFVRVKPNTVRWLS